MSYRKAVVWKGTKAGFSQVQTVTAQGTRNTGMVGYRHKSVSVASRVIITV